MTGDILLHLLLALAAVIAVGRLLARLLARVGQPPVIGEVAAGVLLGPSLIGATMSARVLPPDVAPALAVVAQLGVILYMFIIGLDLHLDELKGRARATVATSLAGIVVPFALGAALSWSLYPRVSMPGSRFRPSHSSWVSRCRSPRSRCSPGCSPTGD